ncbi:hypothetical protein ACH5RR_033895 [Cinchona calisaya]|uniref:Uncharacterized protein n=1 Tax=Cinchona calisaya TaxID=153742 RepID=A0ABD2YD46_9GENT
MQFGAWIRATYLRTSPKKKMEMNRKHEDGEVIQGKEDQRGREWGISSERGLSGGRNNVQEKENRGKRIGANIDLYVINVPNITGGRCLNNSRKGLEIFNKEEAKI